MILFSQLNNVPGDFVRDAVILGLVALSAVGTAVAMWSNLRQKPPHESPTRREFDELKQKVGDIEHNLAPMERRILDGVKEIGKELSLKIEHLGEHEYKARGELWEKLNATAERVAAEEAKGDLAIGIAKAIVEVSKKS